MSVQPSFLSLLVLLIILKRLVLPPLLLIRFRGVQIGLRARYSALPRGYLLALLWPAHDGIHRSAGVDVFYFAFGV